MRTHNVGIFLHLQEMGDRKITTLAERFMLQEDTSPMAVSRFARSVVAAEKAVEMACRAARKLQEIGEDEE